ncbi:MAG TPA: hypothetical protein VGF99_12565, partial [Myxococcota bacterium]
MRTNLLLLSTVLSLGSIAAGCTSTKATSSIARDNRGAKRGADVPDPAGGRLRSAEAWGEHWTLSLAASNSLEHAARFSWGTG